MRRFPITLLVAALAAGGCSSALLTDRGASPDELAEIKSRILELQRTAAMTRVELERLRDELAALEARLAGGTVAPPGSSPAARRPPAVPPAAPPAPSAAAEPAGRDNESMIEVSDLPPTPARPAASPPPATAPSAATPPPSTAPAAAVPPPAAGQQPVTEAAQALYDRGYTLYHQGRYVDAETSFRRFLQSYPDSPLSDNAQYWIGESRFARGDLEGALAAFREASERYPTGNKVADSLLKAADCLRRLGDETGARAGYQEVIRSYPGTAAAAMAEERVGSGGA